MKFLPLAIVICHMVCGLATAQQPESPPNPTIRVEVQRVNVGVLVTDSNGKFVQNLKLDNFHVFDNGAEQPITNFTAVDDPAQILLLVEAGPAVYFLQDAHIFAAEAMLNGLAPGDRIAIFRYDIQPSGVLDFTNDKNAAEFALSGIRFNLGSGKLNLSSSLNGVLDWLSHFSGKKTILLLSTGLDTSGAEQIERLQSHLQTGDVRVLCLSMSGPLRDGKRGSARQLQQNAATFEQADNRLRAIAAATGGRVYFPENAIAIQQIYRQVAELIRNEYSLAFRPPIADGRVHAIDVQVDSLGVSGKEKLTDYRVDFRKAYMAPKPSN